MQVTARHAGGHTYRRRGHEVSAAGFPPIAPSMKRHAVLRPIFGNVSEQAHGVGGGPARGGSKDVSEGYTRTGRGT
jgi:hypothetical protein